MMYFINLESINRNFRRQKLLYWRLKKEKGKLEAKLKDMDDRVGKLVSQNMEVEEKKQAFDDVSALCVLSRIDVREKFLYSLM